MGSTEDESIHSAEGWTPTRRADLSDERTDERIVSTPPGKELPDPWVDQLREKNPRPDLQRTPVSGELWSPVRGLVCQPQTSTELASCPRADAPRTPG
ncbi:hypothetical protein NHX12_020064 [Muraenolepis orangiensis]|uniref:Uncharacterized protein n=1 Tax=Muraenolepis orangiensis TaxID=630683 RepID=A0A9Q0EYG9_9TELE|nr:hypothetical protein NHX12_020064 [Muraenolepis orangiensis]